MRCPSCGARNPEAADWCTQCYTDLRPAPEEPEPPAATPSGTTPRADRPPVDEPEVEGEPSDRGEGQELRTGQGRFRTRDGELEWCCAVCGEWNPLGAGACMVCGTAFGRTLGGGEEEPLADVDQGTVVIASGILPGAGHILLGRTAQGVTRAVFFLFCLIGGYLLLRSAAASGQSLMPAFPLLAGAAIVWAASIYDALALTARQDELLTPRVLVWLIIGVVGLLLVSFIPGLLRVGQLGDDTTQVTDQPDVPAPVETVTVTAPPSETAGPAPGFPPATPPGATPADSPTPFATP